MATQEKTGDGRDEQLWKIGELARATGVTVRTLHHYDEIGLLRPARRTGSNYRLYTTDDVLRLQQILSLRQIGLSLEEIGDWLAGAEATALAAIERQLTRLREAEEATRRLVERLERLASRLREADPVSPAEFLTTMEMMTMFEKYYTAEQLQQLEERRKQVGEERIQQVQEEWARLGEEVRAEMERGTDPSHPRVQALAKRWQGLIDEFTGGDPGIFAPLQELYRNEEVVHGMQVAPMREMGAYIQRAMSGDGKG